MDCIVCKNKVPEHHSACPACGFPVLGVFGPEGQKALRGMAEQYRQKKLEEMEIGVIAYAWKPGESGYQLRKEQEIPLHPAGKKLSDRICWLERPFARTGETGEVELTLYLREPGMPRRLKKVRLERPDPPGFWQIGLRWSETCKIGLCFGNKSRHQETMCDIMEFK